MNVTPEYWDLAIDALKKVDVRLGKIIDRKARLTINNANDPFITLARAIVGQQISVKAAEAVWNRVLDLEPDLTTSKFSLISSEKFRHAGLSRRKIEYIKDLAVKMGENGYTKEYLITLDDKAIVEKLTAIRGIGVWTSEMFLIFFLGRPNIFPLADIGLQRAISEQFKDGAPVSKPEMEEISQCWHPWRTVATWYLWRSIDPIPVEY